MGKHIHLHFYTGAAKSAPVKDAKTPDCSCTQDAHLGFKKLESKLAHEKGVIDPAGLAAAIGRRKFGPREMAEKSEK